jgi:hypothetical protein
MLSKLATGGSLYSFLHGVVFELTRQGCNYTLYEFSPTSTSPAAAYVVTLSSIYDHGYTMDPCYLLSARYLNQRDTQT